MGTPKALLAGLAVVLAIAGSAPEVRADFTTPSIRGLQDDVTKGEVCELQPRCEKLGGKCMGKDECLRQGTAFRWIEPHKEFCGVESATSTCGCCFEKKDPGTTEKALLESIMGEEIGLEPRLLMAGGGLRLSLSPSGGGRLSLTGLGAKPDGSPGDWSFGSSPSGKEPPRPECDERQCSIKVHGYLHNPDVDDVVKPTELEDGVFVSDMTEAVIEVVFDNTESDDKVQSLFKDENNLGGQVEVRFGGSVNIEVIQANPAVEALLKETGFQTSFELGEITGIWTRYVPIWPVPPIIMWPFPIYEENYQLCVQPVRIRHRTCDGFMFLGLCIGTWSYTYSGAGLNFGRPGANLQWGKVDLQFYWKPWVTVIDNSGKYRAVTESEMSSLRAEVSDPECVEVFFAPKFSPSSLYGGGACWSSGTANAKIVTSDEQVSCGVDQTHLAHELGHAVGIMHPYTGHATLADGSTGTLMCGSGWQRDNPRRNSRDNGDNMQNPLLSCYMDYMDWGPDCTDSSSCGSCSAHYPPDSC